MDLETANSVKLVIVGDNCTSKTEFCNAFEKQAKTSIGEEWVPSTTHYKSNVEIRGRTVQICLADTSGQDDYDRLRPLEYSGAHAFIVCYSVVDPASYENVMAKWKPELQYHCKGVPIALVAVHTEQRDDSNIATGCLAPITTAQGEELQKNIKAEMFFECSIDSGTSVLDIIKKTAKHALNLGVGLKPVKVPIVKLLLLGHGNSGKSTLVDALVKNAAQTWFSKKRVDRNTKSTISIDVDYHSFGATTTSFRVFDFAGQIEYVQSHHFLLESLTSEAMLFLVFDASSSQATIESNITYWLKFVYPIFCAENKPRILFFIGTKTDVEGFISTSHIKSIVENIISTDFPLLNKNNHTMLFHFVSSFDSKGITTLRRELLQQGEILLEQSALVDPDLQQLTISLITKSADERVSDIECFVEQDKLIREYKCTPEDIEFCRRKGIISICKTSSECMVCLRPAVLAKIIGVGLLGNKFHIEALQKECKSNNNYIYEREKEDYEAPEGFISIEEVKYRISLALNSSKHISSSLYATLLAYLEQTGIGFSIKYVEPNGYSAFTNSYLSNYFIIPSFLNKCSSVPFYQILLGNRNITNETKIFGELLTGESMSITMHSFNKIQFLLHCNELQSNKYKLFSNLIVLEYDTAITAVLHWTDDNELILIVSFECEEQFSKFKQLLFEAINTVLPSLNHTPICLIHALNYGKLIPLVETQTGYGCQQGEDHSDSSFSTEFIDASKVLSENIYNAHQPWAPVARNQFFSEAHKHKLFKKHSNDSKLSYVELNNDIKIKALVDEFCKVKDLFYKFLTEDMESNFVIEKVLFLYNEELELQFANKYQETYTNLQFRTNVELSSDSEDNKKESKWRQRLLTSLGKHSCSTVGNAHSSVNLTLAWHGTSESASFSIAENNFGMPAPLSPKQLSELQSGARGMNRVITKEIKKRKEQKLRPISDFGYYGRGIYFSHFINYGEQYCNKKYFQNSTDGLEVHPMLLSYVILGKVKPVIEHPTTTFPNFHATPCAAGYDSHYTQVNSKGFPCNIVDNAEQCVADEIVVFDNAQILPRYLVYFRRFNAAVESSNIVSHPKLSYKELPAQVVVWISNNSADAKFFAKQVPSIIIQSCVSLNEAKVWIKNNNELCTALLKKKKLKLITNGYRELDGGSDAPFQTLLLIDSLQRMLGLTADVRRYKKLADKKKSVYVSNDSKELNNFIRNL